MTDKELNNMLDIISENGTLCLVCKYFSDCNGLTLGPNGPIYPPCSDYGTTFESGLYNENDIISEYQDIKSEGLE